MWCVQILEPQDRHPNSLLFGVLNLAAISLTDDSNVSQSPQHHCKSISYWIKCSEYCTPELYLGKWFN